MILKTKGFTLIELLVVVGIIGILASIIFVSLGSAKDNGNDSSIKEGLDQARTEMESEGLASSDYGVTYTMAPCPTSSQAPDSFFYTDPTMRSIIAKLNATNGGLTMCAAGTSSATGNATSWAIESPVKYSTQWWCVSSGNGPKLSFMDESIFMKLRDMVIFTAYAFSPRAALSAPAIGGGNGTLASCP